MISPSRRALRILLLGIAVVLALTAAAMAVTWRLADPSHDRAWQDGQQRLARVRIAGDSVLIGNLRDSRHDAGGSTVTRWTEGGYRLSEVERVWFILSPFNPRVRALAHPFLSFEMADGRFVAVSVEARKEAGETYSAVRGLFPAYEIMVVVGTEEDLLPLRAIAWDDPLYVLPLRASPDQARALFVSLLERAREIEGRPEFYHTVANNCTTNLIEPVNRLIEDDVAWTLGLVPGHSLDEVYERGWLDTSLSLDEVRTAYLANDRIRAAAGRPDFSRSIRASLPSGRP
jgi:hypothetical protein